MANHNIVVLGSSFAGVGISHALLRHVVSTLPSSDSYKVIMVSPMDNFYFKVAAPRMVTRPDLISLEKLNVPISEGFAEYSDSKFQFVKAYATGVNTATHEIKLEPVDSSDTTTTLHYDTLIVATGASSKSALWSPAVPKKQTESEFFDFRDKLKSAKRIIIAGGGAVGVETAGELGFEFGKQKDIILYSGTNHLLARVRSDVGQRAEKYLKDMGVTVVHDLKIISTGNGPDGKEALHLSDGSQTTADLFIDARGSKMNNTFLPSDWLNERGQLSVDDHLRVKAAGSNSRIYAIGDISSVSSGGIMDILSSVPALAATVEYDLTNGKKGAEGTYKGQSKQSMLVPVGRKKAVGVIFGMWLPSCLGYLIKGKTFMADNALGTAKGEKFQKRTF